MPMKEELLHFLWRHKKLPSLKLNTTTGEVVEIIQFGMYNNSSGPDFLEGKIRYKNLTWCGSIEMHLFSSDWYKHKHQFDEAYNNTILHVVWKNDADVYINETKIPCLELAHFIHQSTVLSYARWMNTDYEIPCFQFENENFAQGFIWMRDRLIVERLARKSAHLKNERNLKKVLFELLCVAFGGKTNKEAFKTYADLVDFNLLQRWKKNNIKKMAYLLGLSNLFQQEMEVLNYTSQYKSIQHQHHLNTMEKIQWKNGAVRPQNQPKKRMLELIQLLSSNEVFFLTSEADFFLFKQKALQFMQSIKESIRLSPFMENNIIINALIPFAFYRGKKYNEIIWVEQAIDWLYELKAEKNHIVEKYKTKRVEIQSAADSQALLEWYQSYCLQKKCLSCTVGKKLMDKCV